MAKSDRMGNQSPKPRTQITIGDGSIRDLAYWLMGGDVTVKRGKTTIDGSKVRGEVAEHIKFGERNRQDSAYNIKTDYKGKYSRSRDDSSVTPVGLDTDRVSRKPVLDYPVSTGAIYETGGSLQRANMSDPASVGSIYESAPPPNPISIRTPPQAVAKPVRLVNTMRKPVKPRKPLIHPSMRPYKEAVTPYNIDNPNVQALRGDPTPRDETFGDDFGAGFYMGGPVKKKKKKKRMGYGGKMKKYAKGGGIRKPKYS
jgi:hypothetical protein